MEIKINPIRLITARGFDAAFTELLNCPEFLTQQAVYDYLEKIYRRAYNHNRYSNFDSYRKARVFRLSK